MSIVLLSMVKVSIFSILSLIIVISIWSCFNSPYYESRFKQSYKEYIPKIEQFSNSFKINNSLFDLPNDYFELYQLKEKSYEQNIFSNSKKRADYNDIILFVPGHKGSFSQIIQFQGYLYQKFKQYDIKNFYFKFYAIDFKQTPSAFSDRLIEAQAEYIQQCLKYLSNQIFKKEQKISIIAHSMGGIASLLALRNLVIEENLYVFKNLEKVLFFNSPLSEHPINLDFALQSSYSKIYCFISKYEKVLKNLILISFSGNKGDIEVNREISSLSMLNNQNYYHFLTNDIKDVYLHLRHVETLTNPYFLYKISDFLIDFYINKLNKLNFNIIWYFQHLNKQINNIKMKPMNKTLDFYENIKTLLDISENNDNFKGFQMNEKFCLKRPMISHNKYNDSCLSFDIFSKNMSSLLVKTKTSQETLRIFIYYQDPIKQNDKIISFYPEFKFPFMKTLTYQYYYIIPQILYNQTNVNLLVIKSKKDRTNYQIIYENEPILQKSLSFYDLLSKKTLNFTGISLLNIYFDIFFLIDPLFLKTSIKCNDHHEVSNEMIIMIWKVNDTYETLTTSNEIYLMSTADMEDYIHHEIISPKHKYLQIMLPFNQDSNFSITLEISWFEIFHYLGRTMKQEVISMIIPLSFVVAMIQFIQLIKNQKIECFLMILLKNFFKITFLWGHFNLLYFNNIGQEIWNNLGFSTGQRDEKYRIFMMILLVPSASLIVSMSIYVVFLILFSICEMISLVFVKLLEKIKKYHNRVYFILISIQSILLGYFITLPYKWAYFIISLFFSIFISVFQRNASHFYPFELAKTFYFISILFYLININKILMLLEHFFRSDDLLNGFLEKDHDLIKYLALHIWCYLAQSLRKTTRRNVRMAFSIGLFILIIVMFSICNGKVYLINYLLVYSSIFILFFIIYSFFK